MPSSISTTPPVNSALDLNLIPNRVPILTPNADIINVVIPINIAA